MRKARSTLTVRLHVAFGAAVLTCAGCRAPSPAPRAQPVSHKLVSLVVSSDLQGELRPGGCANNPLGGLARRAAYVNGVKASGTALYLEIGDILSGTPGPGEQPASRTEKARLILERLKQAGLAAWTPGESDLSIGLEGLRSLTTSLGLVTLAANLRDREGRPPFQSSIVVDTEPLRIGLLGLILADADTRERLRSRGAVLVDPIAETRRQIDDLRSRGAQLVVALVHAQAERSELTNLVRQAPGLDWVLLGHPQSREGSTPVDNVLGTKIFAPVDGGIGRIDLHLRPGDPVIRDPGPIGTLRSRIRATEAELQGSVGARSRPPLPLPVLRRQLAEEKKLLDLMVGRQATHSWFEAISVLLDSHHREDVPTLAAITAFERTMK